MVEKAEERERNEDELVNTEKRTSRSLSYLSNPPIKLTIKRFNPVKSFAGIKMIVLPFIVDGLHSTQKFGNTISVSVDHVTSVG